MTLYENTTVQFDDFTHTYFMGDKALIGVTSLMKKHGLAPDYGDIDPAVLEAAAKLGIEAHKMLERFDNGETMVDCKLLHTYNKLRLPVMSSEYLISDNDIVASSIDKVIYVSPTEVDLADVKRTSTIHKTALSWQLGIYKVLFERQNPGIRVRNCFCIHLKKGGKDTVMNDTAESPLPIKPVTEEMVDELFDCERKGTIYSAIKTKRDNLVIVDDLKQSIVTLTARVAEIDKEKKQAEAVLQEYKDYLYNFMTERNLDIMEYDEFTVQLKRPYRSMRLDGVSLKANLPDVYEKYAREYEIKGNITFKLK